MHMNDNNQTTTTTITTINDNYMLSAQNLVLSLVVIHPPTKARKLEPRYFHMIHRSVLLKYILFDIHSWFNLKKIVLQ